MGATLRRMLGLGVLSLALWGGGLPAKPVQAGHCTYYRWVTVYQWKLQAYRACVVRYDHCGRPYTAHVIRYRWVQVPVRKRVLVSY